MTYASATSASSSLQALLAQGRNPCLGHWEAAYEQCIKCKLFEIKAVASFLVKLSCCLSLLHWLLTQSAAQTRNQLLVEQLMATPPRMRTRKRAAADEGDSENEAPAPKRGRSARAGAEDEGATLKSHLMVPSAWAGLAQEAAETALCRTAGPSGTQRAPPPNDRRGATTAEQAELEQDDLDHIEDLVCQELHLACACCP